MKLKPDTERKGKIFRRAVALVVGMLAGLAAVAGAQDRLPPPLYTERGLEMLGLSTEEIDQIMQIQEDSADQIRRHQADLQIKKAELARLLLEDDPNMRLVERNLRESAEIEVEMRLVEIKREYAVREIVGTDQWARIMQALQARRDEIAANVSDQAAQRLREVQQLIAEKQRQLADVLANRPDALSDEEIRRQFQELQQDFRELQEAIQERL